MKKLWQGLGAALLGGGLAAGGGVALDQPVPVECRDDGTCSLYLERDTAACASLRPNQDYLGPFEGGLGAVLSGLRSKGAIDTWVVLALPEGKCFVHVLMTRAQAGTLLEEVPVLGRLELNRGNEPRAVNRHSFGDGRIVGFHDLRGGL